MHEERIPMSYTIRRVVPVFWMTLLTFICGAFPVGIAVCLVLAYGASAALLALVIVLAIPWLYLLVRAVRLRFVADEAGVVVANLFRTHRVAWSEIAQLTTGLGTLGMQMGSGRVEVHVVLASGSTLLSTATGSATEHFEQLAKELIPVMTLASAHGVPSEWKNLSELEKLVVERLLRATDAVTASARTFGRAN